MPGGVAVTGNQRHAAVAEEIVLAVGQLQFVAKIEVLAIVAVLANQFRIRRGLPFEALHHQLGIGQVGIAPDMIEVQMRIDQVVDARGIDIERTQARAKLLAGRK